MAVEAYAIVALDVTAPGPVMVAFCHIRLVDGSGKRPRWQVVDQLTAPRPLRGVPKRYDDPNDVLGRRPPGVAVFPPSVRVADRRVTLTQIRCVFPECAQMPLPIALDYVRDRL